MPNQTANIRIYSTCTSLKDASLLDNILFTDDQNIIHSEQNAEGSTEEFEFYLEGTVSQSSKLYRLRYREAEGSGMEDTTTLIQFYIENPKSITLIRQGSVSSTMLFEPHKRNLSTYKTPLGPLEICTFTSHIENTLHLDGHLRLDYCIEVKGLTMESNHLEIDIVPQV